MAITKKQKKREKQIADRSENRKLDRREKRFVLEYHKNLKAEQAAVDAGYTVYTARAKSWGWVSKGGDKPWVYKAVTEALAERAKRTKIDADYVLKRLASIDRMDVVDILDDSGALKQVKDWPKTWRTYISGIDVSEIHMAQGDEKKVTGILKKIKWPDKVKNLDMIGKHVDVQAWKEAKSLAHSGDINITRTIVDPHGD